ncbi:MAG: metalloregulator ArsR/SmtB family transcription factor [Chloroflexota bacterium]
MSFLLSKNPDPIEVRVTLSPVHSVVTALSLLSADESTVANEPWIKQTADKMSKTEREINRAIFNKLSEELIPNEEYDWFADYLSEIGRAIDPQIGQQMQLSMSKLAIQHQEYAEMQQAFNHFKQMWRNYFMPEWDRKIQQMRSMANNLNTRDWPTQSAEAAVRAFLRRPVPEFIGRELKGVREITFCMSPWLELQAAKFQSKDILWIFVPADARKLPMRYEPIQRSEVMRITNALSDEVRLQILEMLSAFGRMRSQEIMDQLDVSQPTVSRQLKQLKNAGFIIEARDGDATKIFKLNRKRLGEITFMLETLLSRSNARMVLNDPRLDQPAELRKFLNEDGVVYRYPNKQSAQQLIIEFLSHVFEKGTKYSEKEVNELLNKWHTYKDPARLRRDLVDFGHLKRTADGSEYWRE